MEMKRLFLIILDSFGCGEAPDAADFGDEGSNTLKSVWSSEYFNCPNLEKLGLFNIDGVDFGNRADEPIGSYARLQELSRGKDTTIGHWEIAGLISPEPLPVFPDGFPESFIKDLEEATGRKCIVNKPYSGTQIIADYGMHQMETGDLIVYTSADSVFQIAAHEEVIPIDELYDICRKARKLLKGKLGVGRVIARPYVGDSPENFTRTSNRRDFSLSPFAPTMLDKIKLVGMDVIGVGKIGDIFNEKGLTEVIHTTGNTNGLQVTKELAETDFEGLCFVNLVDFDSKYGHRRDPDGYAKAMTEFDEFLTGFFEMMRDEDVLMISADHGCDPRFTKTTDHTREYVPLLIYGDSIPSNTNLGTIKGFNYIAQRVLMELGL